MRRLFFLFLAFLVLLLDQASKLWARQFLLPGVSRPLIPGVLDFTLIENRGIAFGLFHGADKILFLLISVSILFLFVWGIRSPAASRKTEWGLGLILGGAVGNWIDRVRVGAVIDFLDFKVWPVFNLADTAITVGVGLFLLELMNVKGKPDAA